MDASTPAELASAAATWNLLNDATPLAVAQPDNAEGVAKVVKCTRDAGLQLTARCEERRCCCALASATAPPVRHRRGWPRRQAQTWPALWLHAPATLVSTPPTLVLPGQIKYADGHFKIYGQWLGPADEAAASLAADGVVGPGATVNVTGLN